MLEFRRIRVLIPHSRTLYFSDKGKERGITGETVRDFERYLNKKYKKELGKRPLTVFIVPTTRDNLLNDVANGLGDIAAGDITITEERQKVVDFVPLGEAKSVSEVLITGPKSQPVANLDDLAGKAVHVRASSSYFESLTKLSNRLKLEGKAPLDIVPVPDALEDEDLMEMLGAGLFDYLVVDDWLARIWAQVLPGIKVRKDIVLRKGGSLGWAIRKGSPALAAEIEEFKKNFMDRQGVVNFRLAQYYKDVRQITDPTAAEEWQRFEQTLALFQKYGQKYGFDPIMLAAQGYQESMLDQDRRNPTGATGVMQIMPRTGAAMEVGDITEIEPNIHAGAKYMDQIMTRYFPDAAFSEQDRTLFAFASYNAGPGTIVKMRKFAQKQGLDKNKWFHNVELAVAEKIGIQTTTYVRSIYKYYIAYKLTLKHIEEKRNAKELLAPGKK
jgi:membrane-bound lytic murein transglycosylase MltF